MLHATFKMCMHRVFVWLGLNAALDYHVCHEQRGPASPTCEEQLHMRT